MQPKPVRVYTEQDFLQADRMDKIFMHILFPDQFNLNKTDSEYLELLQDAYRLVRKELSDHAVLRLVEEAYPEISKYRRHKLINDVKRLWGNIVHRNKEYDRLVLRERLVKLANRARKAGDLQEERRALQAIIRMDGLDVHDVEKFNPADIQLPTVIFTADPKAYAVEDAEVLNEGS